jgi:ribosomal protein L22
VGGRIARARGTVARIESSIIEINVVAEIKPEAGNKTED